MKNKAIYSALLAIGLVGTLGVGIASAKGLPGFGMFGMGMFNPLAPEETATFYQTMFDKAAQILGISADEIKEAWAEGKSIPQVIKEKGLDQEQIKEKLRETQLAEIKTQLQSLVSEGVITQAQADKRLETLQNSSNWNGNGRMKKMMRGMMGFGTHMGF